MKIGKLRPKKFYNIGPVRNDEKNVFNGDSRMPWSTRISKMPLKNSRKPEIKVGKRFGSIFKLFLKMNFG
jgi:hypothetical protein